MGCFVYPTDPIIVGVEYGPFASGISIRTWGNALTPADIPLTERPWYIATQWQEENIHSTRKREVAIMSLAHYNELKKKPKELFKHIHYIVEQTNWRSPKVSLDESRTV